LSKKIWLITVGEPLPGFSSGDRMWRTGYLAGLLASHGNDVTWWASSFDHFRREQLVAGSERVAAGPNLTLQFLKGRDYTRNVSVARLVNHWQIAREFRRLAAALPRPDAILSSFPTIELSREAVRFGRAHGVPVWLDIRDLWPDEMLNRLPGSLQPLGRMALAPMYASAREALSGATGLIAISNSFLAWGLDFARRARHANDHVLPMGYTGHLDVAATSDATRASLTALGVNPGKRIFWFAGTFVGNIDLGTVIEAARALRDRSHIQFVLSGTGERDSEWREQARGLPNVVFTGWAGKDALSCLASMAWAGLGAYKTGASMSLPNKVFEYMSAGIPVLLSLGGETRDLVVDNEIGLTYEAGDAASLGAAVLRIADDSALRERLSANASRLFNESFSPRSIYGRYADVLTREPSKP